MKEGQVGDLSYSRSRGSRLGNLPHLRMDRSVTCPTDGLKPVALRSGSAKGNKKAGEYSEEDTHRPAHHYREVAAAELLGGFTGQSANRSLEKETR